MTTITFKHQTVPEFIAQGFHSQYIFPVAEKICKGKGVDVGCNNPAWAFPGADPVDVKLDDPWHAYNLPDTEYDYIFSSHCLEHLDDYPAAIKYWHSCLKDSGVLFLYLPHPDCLYWQPTEMPTHLHKHTLTPMIIRDLMHDIGFKDIFYSERDLAYSFAVYGTK